LKITGYIYRTTVFAEKKSFFMRCLSPINGGEPRISTTTGYVSWNTVVGME